MRDNYGKKKNLAKTLNAYHRPKVSATLEPCRECGTDRRLESTGVGRIGRQSTQTDFRHRYKPKTEDDCLKPVDGTRTLAPVRLSRSYISGFLCTCPIEWSDVG